MAVFFYELSCIATMRLLLRRTLIHSGILLSTVQVSSHKQHAAT